MVIKVDYTPSVTEIPVTSEFLRINYTATYIEQLTGVNHKQAKKVLYWLAKMYDETVGINIATITKTAQGVESGLL